MSSSDNNDGDKKSIKRTVFYQNTNISEEKECDQKPSALTSAPPSALTSAPPLAAGTYSAGTSDGLEDVRLDIMKGVKQVQSSRFSLLSNDEGSSVLDDSVRSVLSALEHQYSKTDLGDTLPLSTTNDRAVSVPVVDSAPGAVRVRGVAAQDSDLEGNSKYDNLKTGSMYSEEFRRASIVKAQVVDEKVLEREVLERVRSRTAIATSVESIIEEGPNDTAPNSPFNSNSNKHNRSRKNLLSISLPTSSETAPPEASKQSEKKKRIYYCCAAIGFLLLAIIGGVVGGVVADQGSSSSSVDDAANPTAAPTPISALNELYQMVQITPGDPFPEEGSAQYRALEWLHGQLNTVPEKASVDLVERYVGGVLAYSSDAPETFSRDVLATVGWLTDKPICTWFGMVCEVSPETNETVVVGMLVNGFSEIVGTLPPEVALLSNSLTSFTFANTQIFGTIPSEFGLLTNLESINVSNNKMTGSLPVELGNLKSLKVLNVEENSISGYLPTALGNIGNSLGEFHFGFLAALFNSS